jgi:hypothetical protein
MLAIGDLHDSMNNPQPHEHSDRFVAESCSEESNDKAGV